MKMMEEIDCGNFFDQIDDLLEFPNDDVEKGLIDNGGGGEYDDFPPVFWSEDSPVFSANTSNSASDLSAELSVPYEDIVQLEWLSTFVEDSFAGTGLTLEKSRSTSSRNDSSRNQFQTSSPISVLESSSSTCSKGKTLPVSHEKRARSKRRRPAVFKPHLHFLSPTSSIAKTPRPLFAPVLSFSESGNFAVSRPSKKKKVIKILPPSGRISHNLNENPNDNPNATPQAALRKCMHCEITKTPQWRAGPMGPKTLCNACGVRYKSGRLFPEYRPAASPTFVPSLHSNSHKKVIEMRTKTTQVKPVETLQLRELVPKAGSLPAYM